MRESTQRCTSPLSVWLGGPYICPIHSRNVETGELVIVVDPTRRNEGGYAWVLALIRDGTVGWVVTELIGNNRRFLVET